MAIVNIFVCLVGVIVGIAICSWWWPSVEVETMTISTAVVVAGVVCLVNQIVYLSPRQNTTVGRVIYFVCLGASIVVGFCELPAIERAIESGQGWLYEGVSMASLVSGSVASWYYLRYSCAEIDATTIALAPLVSSISAVGVGVAGSLLCEIIPMLRPILPFIMIIVVNLALGIYMWKKGVLPYGEGLVLVSPSTSRKPSRRSQPISLVLDEMSKIASRHSYQRKCTFDSILEVRIKSECVGGDILFVIDAVCKVGKGARTDYDVERVRASVDSILESIDNVVVSEAQSVLKRAQETYGSYNIEYRVRSKIGNYEINR
ncbi:MAG: hypothetical protein J6Q52_05660 [Clostridia bacterium]|nr:hypothetical protein [Clostridia bacterium]